ncbi:MAG: hypothetical protein CM15mP74_20920 [Halieaceae bacterium]|nr:MAG: hypothetical protein CM15mP74_20920 [Halieaceae bacterium]
MRMDKLTHSLQAALGDAQSLAVGVITPFIEPLHILKAMLDPPASPLGHYSGQRVFRSSRWLPRWRPRWRPVRLCQGARMCISARRPSGF